MARQAPLTDPGWSAPIVRRLTAICVVVCVATYLATIGLTIAIARARPSDPGVQLLGAAAAMLAAVVSAVLLVRTRIVPIFEVVQWSVVFSRQRWASLGFRDPFPDLDVALTALDRRSDDTAISARGTLLAWLGRTSALEELLHAWEPVTPIGRAAAARHRLALDALRGRSVDPSAAIAAANAVPDEAVRHQALVVLRLDAANRAAQAGRSPEGELRAARRLLDAAPLDPPVPSAGPTVPWITGYLAVVGPAMPLAVAGLISSGLPALAVWCCGYLALWLAVRAYGRRLQQARAGGVSTA